MQNEFEKNVQQQMEQFEIVPNEAIWSKVEENIKKDKNRRRFFYYWLSAALLIVISTASYFYMSDPSQPASTSSYKQSSKLSKNSNRLLIYKDSSSTVQNPFDKAVDKAVGTTETSNLRRSVATKVSKGAFTYDSDRGNKSAKSSDRQVAKAMLKKETGKFSDSRSSIHSNNVANAHDNSTAKAGELKEKKDSTISSDITKEVITGVKVKDTATNKKSIVTNTLATAKSSSSLKIKMGIVSLAGVSNNVSALIGLPAAAALRDQYANSPATSSPNTSASVPVINKYSIAFSAGVGVFAQMGLTKRLSINAGVNFHSYTSKLAVGSKVDSATVFNDNQLKKRASVSAFYRVGNGNSYVNRYNLINTPISFQLRLNNNELKPLQLSAGINPGLVINSTSLYYNPQQRVYYKEKQHLRNFQLGLETGLMFTLSNSSKYKFQVGPTLLYNITNLTKRAVATQEHLLFTGLKTSVIF